MIKLDDKFTEQFSPHEQLVMLRLLVGADDDGISKISYRTLAKECGMTLQTCRSALSRLSKKGELEVIVNAGTFVILYKYDDYKVGRKKSEQHSLHQALAALQAKCKEREKAFEKSLIPFVSSRGGIYDPKMIRAFFNYWTEKNKSGTKMRFELEKTWETSKRLVTWASREKQTSTQASVLKESNMNYSKENDW